MLPTLLLCYVLHQHCCFLLINIKMMNKVVKTMRLLNCLRSGFSELTKASSRAPARRDRLQFSKHRLLDFGELPHGEIPEALRAVRPSETHKLSNEIRVGSEHWSDAQPAITVLVKAGSRQENLSNSSVANFVAQGALNGTAKYSKDKIDELVDSFGGSLSVKVGRQVTQYTLSFESQFLSQAVELLSQIILKPNYEATQHEALKATLHKQASPMDPYVIATESLHYTAFRDHYFGHPSYGVRDVIYSITPEQVKEFHNQFYVGRNIVVSGAGNIDGKALTTQVGTHFGSVPAFRVNQVPNSDKPYFTPSLIYQRDDQMLNTAFAVAFQAPTWNDPDFFAMQYFKRIIGEYRCDKFTGQHLNSAHLQYNSFHTYLGNYPDMILHQPFYFPYSDTGLFGNFIYGNQMYTPEMSVVTQNQMSIYAQYINQAEVFRARNRFFNDLLEHNDPTSVSLTNGQQLAYLDRLISRTEKATRISHMTPSYVSKVASKWFWDKETAVVGYGNLHSHMSNAHYNRTFKRATLGDYSQVAVHFQY